MRYLSFLAVVGVLWSSSTLSAQGILTPEPTCSEGRVTSAQTAGRCCWPGQVWADAYGRCSGPPACPPGLAAEGDDCVVSVTTVVPRVTVVPADGGRWTSGRSASLPDPEQDEQRLHGVHFFLGLSVGGGLSIISINPDPATLDGDFLGAIVLGMTAGRFELRLEAAPVSFLPSLSRAAGYSLMVSVGGLVHLGGPVYWPLRFGVGVWGPIDGGEPFLQAQADLLGLAFKVGDWMIEVNAPTYRFLTNFDDRFYYVLSVQFGFRYLF